jgi:tetratricopeptide (TPR) repeat protein
MEDAKKPVDTSVSMNGKRSGIIKLILLVVILALPLIYLFYKTNDLPANVNQDQPAPAPNAAVDIPALEKAVAENPTVENLVNLSTAYINNQMPGKSIEHLKRAVELDPKSAVAYNDLGVAYTMLQQYQNGIDACRMALKADTSFQLAKNNLKWATDERDKVIAAIGELEKVSKEKKNAAYYMDLGMDHFKIGDYDKAIEIWSKAAEMDPKSGAPLSSIGTAFMMKNQVDDAIAIFKKAVAMNPDDQLAKNNLAWATDEKTKASIKK